MPLFEIRRLAWSVPPTVQYDALLLTSGNAVREAGEGLMALSDLPIFAVGSATARAAHAAGLIQIAVGDSGVDKVLEMAGSSGHKRLLWLAGEDRIAVTTPLGMTIDICAVYRSAALSPPNDFADTVRSVDVVLLHSPRAARHFAALCDVHAIDRAALTLGAYSQTIADSAGSGWKSIITAPEPNDESLLAHLRSYFTTADGGL